MAAILAQPLYDAYMSIVRKGWFVIRAQSAVTVYMRRNARYNESTWIEVT